MRTLVVYIMTVMLAVTTVAMNYSNDKSVRIIDDFEDGTMLNQPEWWRFGNLEIDVVKDQTTSAPSYVEDYVLQLRGNTESWYVGGLGVYSPMSAVRYNYIKLIIKGYGSSSGSLLIELYDDDNENAYIEQNEYDSSYTLYDDKFIYTLKVNWSGWKVVEIPLRNFKDSNPGIGDNIWNPNRRNGSGGFTQIQLLLLSDSRNGSVEIDIDTIKLFVK